MKSLADKENESKKYFQQYNNTLTLDRAIQLSVERNLTLKTKTIEQEIAKLDRKIAFGSKKYFQQYNNTLTLDRAIQLSVERNLTLKTKTIEQEIAKLDRKIAFGNFLPKVSLGYSYTMLNDKIMGETKDTALPIPLPMSFGLETRLVDKNLSLFSVNAQMPIFVPATWFLYSARQKGEDISSLTRDLTEKMIKLQTIGQYHYILALESEKEYLKQELESA